jgi:hypothetical protein
MAQEQTLISQAVVVELLPQDKMVALFQVIQEMVVLELHLPLLVLL